MNTERAFNIIYACAHTCKYTHRVYTHAHTQCTHTCKYTHRVFPNKSLSLSLSLSLSQGILAAKGSLSMKATQFVSAEILSGLEYLHRHNKNTHGHTHTHTHTHTHIHAHTHMVCVYMCIVFLSMYGCMHACMHIHIYFYAFCVCILHPALTHFTLIPKPQTLNPKPQPLTPNPKTRNRHSLAVVTKLNHQ